MTNEKVNEINDDIKDTLDVMNKIYRGYLEQEEPQYKIALLISLEMGARSVADSAWKLKNYYVLGGSVRE